ncbi:hypothetical protein ETH_00035465 [Eimeria tenella]|uniref:Uncharacterized protein n=1 Tax=Eimeria tenella TaxID=5802 RepID=U6KUS7_EIMTE|nr:hypothetical protein ETH_00035465 [Eimeria tenella]CDJ39255.1 hypothetical protein ETH_00035465 [Eimeria tenella]|eukprot:XP_013230010.1 hypothetical protein ETH_00035465 [Eimeria tenella]
MQAAAPVAVSALSANTFQVTLLLKHQQQQQQQQQQLQQQQQQQEQQQLSRLKSFRCSVRLLQSSWLLRACVRALAALLQPAAARVLLPAVFRCCQSPASLSLQQQQQQETFAPADTGEFPSVAALEWSAFCQLLCCEVFSVCRGSSSSSSSNSSSSSEHYAIAAAGARLLQLQAAIPPQGENLPPEKQQQCAAATPSRAAAAAAVAAAASRLKRRRGPLQQQGDRRCSREGSSRCSSGSSAAAAATAAALSSLEAEGLGPLAAIICSAQEVLEQQQQQLGACVDDCGASGVPPCAAPLPAAAAAAAASAADGSCSCSDGELPQLGLKQQLPCIFLVLHLLLEDLLLRQVSVHLEVQKLVLLLHTLARLLQLPLFASYYQCCFPSTLEQEEVPSAIGLLQELAAGRRLPQQQQQQQQRASLAAAALQRLSRKQKVLTESLGLQQLPPDVAGCTSSKDSSSSSSSSSCCSSSCCCSTTSTSGSTLELSTQNSMAIDIPQHSRCSNAHAGGVDASLLGPPAALAWGLIYFSSGDEAAARALLLPATSLQLEECLPNTVAYKTRSGQSAAVTLSRSSSSSSSTNSSSQAVRRGRS